MGLKYLGQSMSILIQKWSALKKSEQQLLQYGIPLIVVAVIYFYVWLPYNKSIAEVRQQVSYAKEDIVWLKSIAVQVKKIKSGSTSSLGSFSGSFINTVDKSIKQNRLNKYVTLLEKSGNNKVVVKFDKINFDHIVKYLGYLKNRYGILVKTIDVERTEDGKFVNSRLILKKQVVL